MASENKASGDKMVAVEMPPKFWVVVLFALNQMHKSAVGRPMQDRVAAAGGDVDKAMGEMTADEVTATVGPLMAIGAITKAMHAAGEMTDEANANIGLDALIEKANKAKRDGGV